MAMPRDDAARFSCTAAMLALCIALTGCPKPSAPNPSKSQNTPPTTDTTKAASDLSKAPEVPTKFADWPKPAAALVLTGQLMGYIEPCGCTGLENQKGGLARRHTLLRELTDERGWNVVPLDVGNQVKSFGKEQEIKFASVVQGLRTMGYKAVALGDGDLRLTPGEILASIAGNDGTVRDFVGSNVAVLARELQPRSLVIEAGGLKLGIASALGEKFEARLRGDELVHEPPSAGLKIAAEELKSQKCDMTVLLAHASLDEAKKLAQEVPSFDLVVASGDTSLPSRELEEIQGTKTRMMQVGLKAMHVGVVGIYPGETPPLRYESVTLDARFGDSPEMLQLLADFQDQLQELGLDGLNIKLQPHPSTKRFVGSAACGDCHSKAFEKWQNTSHSHATDSLVMPPNSRGSIARHFDPECLSCHVTGWEPQQHYPFESGYLSLEKTPLLTHVGCENCHGPGSAHVAAESGTGNLSADAIAKIRSDMRLTLDGAERKCIECHDLDNSPDFHKPDAFEKYWKKIEHPGRD
jgi:hypothetical protein